MRALLIGCGRIGFLLEDDPLRNKPCTHAGGMISAGITLSGAADIDESRLARVSKRFRIPESALFGDYRELLGKVPADIITIALPTPMHAKAVIAAAECGARVIICEKPSAHRIPDARRMTQACRANGVHLIINHERRFDPRYRTVKKMIDAGVIGPLVSIRGILSARGMSRASDPLFGGGPLLHDGTHLVDLIAWYAGAVTGITGRWYRKGSGYEDLARAMLETEQGVPAYIEVGGDTRYFGFGLEISGTHGKIEIGNGYNRLYKAEKSKLYKGFFDLKEKPFPAVSGAPSFTQLYRSAAGLVKGKGENISSGDDGLHALRVIHGIYSSASRIRPAGLPDSINIKKIFAL